jgi:hypothetical protein
MPGFELFGRLGLSGIPEKDKDLLSEELGAIVLDRIAIRLEQILNPKQAQEIEYQMETDGAAAIGLIKTYVPNFESLVSEEIAYLQSEIISAHEDVVNRIT